MLVIIGVDIEIGDGPGPSGILRWKWLCERRLQDWTNGVPDY